MRPPNLKKRTERAWLRLENRPAVENIIAFIEGAPQNLATDKDIER
jgi:hypothetical protein